MLIQSAEDSFQRGLRALRNGHRREALAYFESAAEMEQRMGVRQPQARYLSYMGLCLALSRIRPHEGERMCRVATKIEGFNPDLQWNLGRVLVINGRRRHGYKALRAGLKIEADHTGILEELRRLGVRRRPVLPFLARSHPVNVWLGRIRRNLQEGGETQPAARAA